MADWFLYRTAIQSCLTFPVGGPMHSLLWYTYSSDGIFHELVKGLAPKRPSIAIVNSSVRMARYRSAAVCLPPTEALRPNLVCNYRDRYLERILSSLLPRCGWFKPERHPTPFLGITDRWSIGTFWLLSATRVEPIPYWIRLNQDCSQQSVYEH